MPVLPRLPTRPEDFVRNRINRAPSPWFAAGLPWLSILLASMITFSPIVASAPVLPPVAFMVLLAWRMLRPSLLPVWIGLPLGLWDDLLSGQPVGSAVILWSSAMLAMEVIDARFLWRGFVQDWLAASALLTAYLFLAATFAGLATGYPLPLSIGPQLLLSIVLFPVINRTVALLDRVRLIPLRRL